MNLPRLLFRLLLGQRLPLVRGTVRVRGISRPVTIRRDSYGIPHIEAETDRDAWYGLGFCQGQDRAFQAEGLLRVVRGTLAELVGRDALLVDRISRRIGFYHASRRQLEQQDEEVLGMLDAFARGITQGARAGCRRVAHEFTLLRARPTPYTPADVLGVLKLQAFMLSSNWDLELVRLKVLQEDGPDALAALEPSYPEWLPVASPPGVPAGPALDRLAGEMAALKVALGVGGASNNWAMAASRTASGRPILANDPHLVPFMPPHWYLAHVSTPEWSVAGASFVGIPAFPVGHNGTAAWGVTAALVDNSDLFIEEPGADGRSVRVGDRFVPCQVRREVIRVRGGGQVVEEVLVTPRGPVIGPALAGDMGAVSLSATWLDKGPVSGLARFYRARSFEEFRRAFQRWPGPSLNVAYADTSGDIGWQVIGDAPRRRKGWGVLPSPGWDPESGWDGLVPFDELPHALSPGTGFIATANTQPLQEGQGPFLGVDWIDGYRLARIVEALAARKDWDVASVMALQVDRVSIPWREMRDVVLSAPVSTDAGRRAVALLRDWDGTVAADSPAASVFELFVAELTRRVVRRKAPRAMRWALGQGFTPLFPLSLLVARRVGQLSRLLRQQPEGWTEQGWPQEVADALSAVVTELERRYGADPGQWAWGRIRPLTLAHLVGARKPLDRIFNRGPLPWGGDANTIAQAAPDPADPTCNPLAIPSLRMVLDVGNWEEGRFSLPGGQSGNPLSPHYDDLLALWLQGKGVPIAWGKETVQRTARDVLRLVPA